MSSLEKIMKLEDQRQKGLELIEKYKQKVKALDEQIRYLKGEEFNERISRLNLTTEELDRVLKLLDKDNKAQLLDVIGALEAPDAELDTASGNVNDTEPEEEAAQQEQDPANTGTDDTDSEAPVFDEEGEAS